MRIRILLAVTATLALGACAESASTAPGTLRPGSRSATEISCRSGYHIATRADGTQYCEADAAEGGASRPVFAP